MIDPVAGLQARGAELAASVADLDARLDSLRRARGADSADDEHDPEGSTLSSDWSHLEGLRAALHREAAEVDAALERVSDGSYGRCEGCGEPIPAGRLEVRPAARRCVACAS